MNRSSVEALLALVNMCGEARAEEREQLMARPCTRFKSLLAQMDSSLPVDVQVLRYRVPSHAITAEPPDVGIISTPQPRRSAGFGGETAQVCRWPRDATRAG